MFCCYFCMAGLEICLETPWQMQLSDRLKPFVSMSRQPDCTIRLRVAQTLPRPAENAIENGAVYYEGLERIFYRTAPDGPFAAVTTLDEAGDILVEYLPEYADWFSGFSGIFNRIGIELLLLRHKGLMLHASVIDHRGKGVLFTGPSGIGKSTQAALWESCRGAQILNGDRAGLRKNAGSWYAWGLPYAGSSGIYRNASAPVAAVVVLRQAKENCIRQLSAAEAMRYLYPELAVHRWNREFVEQATELLLDLLGGAPVWLLECVPEESAVRLLEGVLS